VSCATACCSLSKATPDTFSLSEKEKNLEYEGNSYLQKFSAAVVKKLTSSDVVETVTSETENETETWLKLRDRGFAIKAETETET